MLKKIVVAGGGSASSVLVGHLIRNAKVAPSNILVVEPRSENYYQPGFTMVGGGLLGDLSDPSNSAINIIRHQTRDMFHPQVEILNQSVKSFNPANNQIITSEDKTISYEHLIVALGIQLNYESIPGLVDSLEDPSAPVGSIYRFDYAVKMNKIINSFKGGKAVFHIPPQPIKCAGAPQKIMYLAKDKFIKNNIQSYTIDYYMAQPTIFSVPKYSKSLTGIAKGKGIELHYEHVLTKVDKSTRIATFKNKEGKEVTQEFDLLHVPPPQKAPDVLKSSEIVDAAGFVTIDKDTMRHTKYANIWALGDCTNLPTSKTLAAGISQSNILTHNLSQVLDNKSPSAKYVGYTSCPIFVGQNKLMLCEFKYAAELDETFSYRQEIPSRLYYLIKRFFFPYVYKYWFKKGWWYGKTTIFKPRF